MGLVYVEKQPVAWEDCCVEYWCEKPRKCMSRRTGRRDITEKLLKMALNPNQSINQFIDHCPVQWSHHGPSYLTVYNLFKKANTKQNVTSEAKGWFHRHRECWTNLNTTFFPELFGPGNIRWGSSWFGGGVKIKEELDSVRKTSSEDMSKPFTPLQVKHLFEKTPSWAAQTRD